MFCNYSRSMLLSLICASLTLSSVAGSAGAKERRAAVDAPLAVTQPSPRNVQKPASPAPPKPPAPLPYPGSPSPPFGPPSPRPLPPEWCFPGTTKCPFVPIPYPN